MASSSRTLVGPRGYVHARREAEAATDGGGGSIGDRPYYYVDGRPYFPLLEVDPSDEATVLEAARTIVSCRASEGGCAGSDGGGRQFSVVSVSDEGRGKIAVITGGLTNALFKVDLPPGDGGPSDSVLVRIFGADGMIDRDEETAMFARLCGTSGGRKGKNGSGAHDDNEDGGGGANGGGNAGGGNRVVHPGLDLLGRFRNGRVETWIPAMREAHHVRDLGREGLAREVARQMARLHYGFDGAETGKGAGATSLQNSSDGQFRQEQQQQQQPALWTVTQSWIEELSQLLSQEAFRKDPSLLELFFLAATGETLPDASPTAAVTRIRGCLVDELDGLRKRVEARHPDAPIVFCHNDVNAGNILLHASVDAADATGDGDAKNESAYNRDTVCIIDFEYGAANYAMYDAANFFCEHCGGNDDGAPDPALLPDAGRQATFLEEYVRERDAISSGRDGANVGVAAAATAKEATSREIAELRSQAELFRAASDLYWGTWGLLQAAREVADGTFRREGAAARMDGVEDSKEWDNLRYGRNRLDRFRAAPGLGQYKD